MKLKTLIIIPTLNEKKNIKKIFSKIKKLNFFLNILFIDDNSKDGTQKEILNLSHKKTVNYIFRKKKGIGSAHRDGIKWAIKNKYDFCVTIDADGAHNPNLISKMLKIIKKNSKNIHIVNTNRFLKKNSLEGWSFLRILITTVRFGLVKIFLNTSLDSSGGLRLYNLNKIKKEYFNLPKNNEYFYLIESLYYYEKLGLKITEIPIKLKIRDYGSSKMKFYHVINSLYLLLILSFKKIN